MNLHIGERVLIVKGTFEGLKGTVTGIFKRSKEIQLDGNWYYGSPKNLKVVRKKRAKWALKLRWKRGF